GKSIIIDALGLLLGDRASPEMIRTGSERALVEGIFGIEGNTPLINLLVDSGVDVDQGELIIKRELGGSRGRIFVNNSLANASLLKSMHPHLIDLHGQGDQQSLLSPDAHLILYDTFAGAGRARQRTSQSYDELLKILKELEEARKSESERLQALDLIDFQISEIEHAGLAPREDVELDAERKLLANAEKLALLCSEVYRLLYEDEDSALSRLGTAQRRLGELADLDSHFTAQLDQLVSARHAIDDTAAFVRDYVEGVQASPERLKFVEDRLIELDRLKRKYGKNIEEIIALKEGLIDRRESLLRSEENAQRLEKMLAQSFVEYQRAACDLSEARRVATSGFERSLKNELSDVALQAARFSVRFSEVENNQVSEKLRSLAGLAAEPCKRSGREQVEFFFSANPGEDLRPISAVASGGELSRLMLVLKTIIAPSQFPRTLIFDEIDAGIGGKVADAVGQRLKRLAETNQVLCVTHQSQIARYADAHFQVAKEVVGGRTITKVVELNKEGRIEELARMIGGAEVTPLARKHARELLKIG
ncbi:MAG: DNA repair protein RecN, partial [Blastocatellia bacterium]|nr:DNA repair protein RecN [Blastocatellia bacterium]